MNTYGAQQFSPQAAKRVGLITDDHSIYPVSHVGVGHVQGDDFERFQTFDTKVVSFVNLLEEAKSRCKVLLAGQGIPHIFILAFNPLNLFSI